MHELTTLAPRARRTTGVLGGAYARRVIARLIACNFRSVVRETVELHPAFTVLVGANGGGKSAILRALDLVCGQTWPTLRSLRVPQDWHGFDDQQELLLRGLLPGGVDTSGGRFL